MKIALGLGLGLLAIGCGSPGSQVITGQIDHATFASGVDRVTVTHGGKLVVASPVQADGSFTITVPVGSAYHLNFSTPTARAGLVNPRTTGTIGVTFAVRGHGADFHLGTVRLIGDANTVGFKYRQAGDGSDAECEDGLDASGAVCVDDEGDGETCDGQDGENNDGEAEDGADDGETADDGEADDSNNDGMPDQAAVADRNLPPTMGCGDHENDGEEEGDH